MPRVPDGLTERDRMASKVESGEIGSPWRVLVLSRHEPQGASSRLRTFQYIKYLKAAGADVVNAPFFDEKYLRRLYVSRDRGAKDVLRAYLLRLKVLLQARHKFHVAWIEKETLPFGPGLLEGWLGWLGLPYIVDYDDATFHTYDEHPRPIVRKLLGRKLDPLLRNAFAVTVGNTYLARYAESHGARRIVHVPTVVDLSRYPLAGSCESDHELRIGWIGTPATSKYLEILREPLLELSRRHALRFVTIGAPPELDLGVPMEHHSWAEDTEARLLAGIDVGVMPLPDAPWERGKCGYKLIQYMAVGKPVVASPVGVNRELVSESVGALASSLDEWVSAIDRFARDRVYARTCGAAGRDLVREVYSLEAQAPRIASLLSEAGGRSPTVFR